MRIFIPDIGFRFRLAAPWRFELYPERRNRDLFDALGVAWPAGEIGYGPNLKPAIIAELPAGSLLTVKRVYIRQGVSGFSSITFTLAGQKRLTSFWAKLYDVNKIEAEVRLEDQPWWFGVREGLDAGRSAVVPRSAVGKGLGRGSFELLPLSPVDPVPLDKVLVISRGERVWFGRCVSGGQTADVVVRDIAVRSSWHCSGEHVARRQVLGVVDGLDPERFKQAKP